MKLQHCKVDTTEGLVFRSWRHVNSYRHFLDLLQPTDEGITVTRNVGVQNLIPHLLENTVPFQRGVH